MKKPIFIFILCPPFQGSTVLLSLLASSKKPVHYYQQIHVLKVSGYLVKMVIQIMRKTDGIHGYI